MITTPNPKLTGFEAVVASSNNGAVENVSKEIPGPKGIDGQWRDAAAAVNYFSQTAGHDAWAMVAARLGNGPTALPSRETSGSTATRACRTCSSSPPRKARTGRVP